MPIVVVTFNEPVTLPAQCADTGNFRGFPHYGVLELTLYVEQLPVLLHPEDGSPRGYLAFPGEGVDFAARTIKDVRIIL